MRGTPALLLAALLLGAAAAAAAAAAGLELPNPLEELPVIRFSRGQRLEDLPGRSVLSPSGALRLGAHPAQPATPPWMFECRSAGI